MRKLFVCAVATGVNDSYEVIKEIMQLIQLPCIDQCFPNAELKWAQDTKMICIFGGMSRGGSYPCWSCPHPAADGFNDSYPLFTILELAEYSRQYATQVNGKSDTFDKKNRKTFYN